MSKILNFGGKKKNEDHPHENKWRLFRGCCGKGGQPISLVLGRDSKAGRGVRKLESEKGKASGVLWLEAVAMGKLEVAN